MKESAENTADMEGPVEAGSAVDSLDRRIIAALQVNGRAGWRQIAAVIGAPERTVAAHGAELIRSGLVRIAAFTPLPKGGALEQTLVNLRCRPGMSRVVASAAADRADTVFTFLTTGEIDCVFEVIGDRARMRPMLLDELPALPGATNIDTSTVIELYKAAHQWLPGILTAEQVSALRDRAQAWEPPGTVELPALSREELEIVRILTADGRATIEELARVTALSAASARRRLAQLQASGRLFIRAVVEPAVLGFPVDAILRIRTDPGSTDRLARILKEAPEIRYLAFTTGRYQLFAEIACTSHSALTAFLFREDWTAFAREVDTSLVIEAVKRSGIRAG